MKWFKFSDMHSGGYRKTKYDEYFVEAPDEEAAERIFEEVTGEYPYSVACECCGCNFSVCETEAENVIAAENCQIIRNSACPHCGREESGHWFIPCPSDDCPSRTKPLTDENTLI